MSEHVPVRAEGIPEIIHEGRVFFLDCDPDRVIPGALKPPRNVEFTARDGAKHPDVQVAGPDMPEFCPVCSERLRHGVSSHDSFWMTMVFYCPEHQQTLWLDLFPKAFGPDEQTESSNKWKLGSSRGPRIQPKFVLGPEGLQPA